MDYLIPTLQELYRLLGEFFNELFNGLFRQAEPPSHDYTSEFVSSNSVLDKSNAGYCLDGERCLLRKAPNAMILAPSGAGKTTVVSIPSLLKIDGSIICNDPSGEQYEKTAGYLAKQGYDIQVINFSQINGTYYNPLARIKDVADAQKIASMLVRNVLEGAKDPFWNISATNLLSLAIRILLHQEIGYRNFANVRHLVQLLSYDPKRVDALVAHTQAQDIIADYKTFIIQDTKLRTSVIATAMSALQIFADPIVAQVTSKDTLNVEVLRKKKTAIFLHSSTSDMKYYATLISIFFEQTTKVIMSSLPDDDDYYTFFILDELSSLFLPTLEITVANIRKYKGSLLCILQSFQQLINIYGREQAEAIRMNCFAKMYFAGMDHNTAEELSKQLGKYTYCEDEEGTRKNVRELMTSNELRTMNREQAILICGNNHPMKIKLRPYYDNPFLNMKTKLSPPLLSHYHVEPIPFIES